MEVSELISWMASMFGLIAFLKSVLPLHYVHSYWYDFLRRFSPYTEVLVSENRGTKVNELYKHVEQYLSSVTFDGARKSQAFLAKNTKKFSYHPAPDENISDIFCGMKMEWTHGAVESRTSSRSAANDEKRWYSLRMNRIHKEAQLEKYLQHIVQTSKKLQWSNRQLRLYCNRTSYRGASWEYVSFQHPTTFDTIALPPELKRSIIEDLDEFINGGEFYRSIGKPWKRGYLLYGPPGTGKTSVVAAMANKLHYDIYDLELTEVRNNAELRSMLVETTSKSIIVIEDIDCSLDLSGARKKAKKEKSIDLESDDDSHSETTKRPSEMTLSGLLNFTDGLWSSTENERIFVFTTNHVEKLDPALLRSGRMDMHIHLGFCTFAAFKILARTFLKIEDDVERYPQVEELLGDGVNISPSEVAELLMRNRKNTDSALDKLIDILRDHKANFRPAQALDHDRDDDADSNKNWETMTTNRQGEG